MRVILPCLATLWPMLGLVACNGNKDGIVAPPETGTDTPPTLVVHSDEASVIVLSQLPSQPSPSPETVFLGMFTESQRGVLNLSQCIASATPFCVEELPRDAGDSVVATVQDPALKDALLTRDVGNKLTLGPWTAKVNQIGGLQYFFSSEPDVDLPSDGLGLHIPGGDGWDEYQGTDDITPPTPMAVTSPDPMDITEFFSNAPIHLAWKPGDGDVYLYAETSAEQRVYKLDDSGSYDLDLSGLHLKDGDPVNLILGRWAVTTLDLDGNSVDMEIQSNQAIRGTWRTIGSRDPLYDFDDECVDAETAPSAVPGNYYGDLRSFAADLNPVASGCTGNRAPGPDAVVPIDLQSDDPLTVNYQLIDDDASLYLVTDCTDAASCLDGSDATGKKGVETATYYNDTHGPVRVYAILDSDGPVTDRFNLDIFIDSLGGSILVPTCVEALDQGPAVSGSYHGSIGGFQDLLEPSCAAPATGAEGMTQVLLLPGQELSAKVDAAGGDPKLYLLSNCAIADSCFLAENVDSGTTEEIDYVNASASSEYLYLVVDADANLGDYLLDLTIQ